MADTTSLSRGMHPNSEMTIIGYLMAVVMIVLLVPLIPFFLVYLFVDWLLGEAGAGGQDYRAGQEPSPRSR